VKVDGTPSLTHVRVCDAVAGPDCAQASYEGDVVFGTPVPVCASQEDVIYRERDPSSGNYGAPITGRCDASTDVEL